MTERPQTPPPTPDPANPADPADADSITVRRSLFHRLRAYFLTGVVVIAPIAITVYLTWAFVHAVDVRVRPLIPAKYDPETYLPFGLPGMGLFLVIIVVTLIGALTANFFGRALLRAGERILNRTPVVRSIYATLKQIFETVVSRSTATFQQVVLIEYPRKGIWAIGFITSDTRGEIQRRSDEDLINIFLPTTPNPTSGFLLFVPRDGVVYLDMSVEEAIKNVISAGLVSPPDRGAPSAEPAKPTDNST